MGVLQGVLALAVLCFFLKSTAYGEHNEIEWHLLKSEASIEHCQRVFNEGKMVGMQSKDNGGYTLSKYELTLSDKDKKEISKIRYLLKKIDNKPFLIKEIISKLDLKPKRAADLLFLLRDKGEIEFIGQDFWLGKIGLDKMISNINTHFISKKVLTVNDFKGLTGLSRKTAIPLMEYLDSKKITFRHDNVRIKGSNLS